MSPTCRRKFLIIEDSPDIGGALKILIELEGYDAILADRAFKGRELAASHYPDLIIVDIRLPDEDGLELTRELRVAPETSVTPILCVSSYTYRLRNEALAAGCNEVFSKSSFMECYQATLQKYLSEPETDTATRSRSV